MMMMIVAKGIMHDCCTIIYFHFFFFSLKFLVVRWNNGCMFWGSIVVS